MKNQAKILLKNISFFNTESSIIADEKKNAEEKIADFKHNENTDAKMSDKGIFLDMDGDKDSDFEEF